MAGRSEAHEQLPLAPDQGRFATVTRRDPRSGAWAAFPPDTQLFGGARAAPHYNCISRMFTTLPARRLKIGIPAPRQPAEEALLAFTELNLVLCFDLK